MNKRKERIKYLVGVYNLLRERGSQNVSDLESGLISYSLKDIKSAQATIEYLLKQDNIFPMNASEKVN